MRNDLQARLEIERAQPGLCLGCYRPDYFPIGSEPGQAERPFGPASEARSGSVAAGAPRGFAAPDRRALVVHVEHSASATARLTVRGTTSILRHNKSLPRPNWLRYG